jgi:hypothetical protein
MAVRVTLDTVRQLALAMPDVKETTSWGMPSFKAKKKLMCVMASHKSAEPDSLVVICDFIQREALMAANPKVFYVKPHYINYSCVLVRLPQITKSALKEVLADAYEHVTRRKPKGSK